MEDIKCLRFRLMMQVMEPYFQKDGLKLLHSNYGYIVFSTNKLHERFKNKGNGQWQDIKDLFFFTLSFNAEEKGVKIELWCYSDSSVRKAWDDALAGRSGLYSRFSKKGFDQFYEYEIIPQVENKDDLLKNTERMIQELRNFFSFKLKEIETILLGI